MPERPGCRHVHAIYPGIRLAEGAAAPESKEPRGLRRALPKSWWPRAESPPGRFAPDRYAVRRNPGGQGRNRHLVDLRQTATRSGEILVAKGNTKLEGSFSYDRAARLGRLSPPLLTSLLTLCVATPSRRPGRSRSRAPTQPASVTAAQCQP
jgi:hypothetical protein